MFSAVFYDAIRSLDASGACNTVSGVAARPGQRMTPDESTGSISFRKLRFSLGSSVVFRSVQGHVYLMQSKEAIGSTNQPKAGGCDARENPLWM